MPLTYGLLASGCTAWRRDQGDALAVRDMLDALQHQEQGSLVEGLRQCIYWSAGLWMTTSGVILVTCATMADMQLLQAAWKSFGIQPERQKHCNMKHRASNIRGR